MVRMLSDFGDNGGSWIRGGRMNEPILVQKVSTLSHSTTN